MTIPGAASAHLTGLTPAEPLAVSSPAEIPSACVCTWVPASGEWRLKVISRICREHGELEVQPWDDQWRAQLRSRH